MRAGDVVDQPRYRCSADELASARTGRRPVARRRPRPGIDAHRAAHAAVRERLAGRVAASPTPASTSYATSAPPQATSVAGDRDGRAGGAHIALCATAARHRGWLSEHIALLESIGDPTLTVGLLVHGAGRQGWMTGEMAEVSAVGATGHRPGRRRPHQGRPASSDRRWRRRLTCRGVGAMVAWASRLEGRLRQASPWRDASTPCSRRALIVYEYALGIPNGALLPDASPCATPPKRWQIAERSGDDLALDLARYARGIALVHQDGPERDEGLELLAQVRDAAVQQRFTLPIVPVIDIHFAKEKATVRRSRWRDRPGAGGRGRLVRLGWRAVLACAGHQRLGGGAAAARRRRRPTGSRRPRSTGWRPCRPIPDSCCTNSGCCGCAPCWLGPVATRPAYRDFRGSLPKHGDSLGFEGHMAMAEAMP